ncbi:MAG: hypothetical protein JW913_08095 [Chitinispirillaceae bacterium]|nr:hypothetical protein [Chitinispirillaceae bacterium]
MRKTIVSLLIVGIFAATAHPFQLGVEFSVGEIPQVGANMRFNDLFELKPQLEFSFSENNNALGLCIDGNFYLPDISDLQHYAGFGFNFLVQSDYDSYAGLNGHYGLRYNINDIFSIFGELGIWIKRFDPFYMTTFKGGIGCTIYFPNF